MSLTYEEMPQAAKNAYDKTNKKRKKTLFISAAGMIIAIISLIIGSMTESDSAMSIFLFGVLVTCIHGWMKLHLHFKSLPRKLGLIGIIAWFWLTYIGGAILGGWIVIIDMIRFFMKKPLIDRSEHKYFMELPEVRDEMYMNTVSLINAQEDQHYRENAMENIKKLKEMLDSGIITEDEFNKKKSELLEMI